MSSSAILPAGRTAAVVGVVADGGELCPAAAPRRVFRDNINIGLGFGSKNAVQVIGPGSVWTKSGSCGVGGYGSLCKFGEDGVYSVMVLGKLC
jgi:T5SS/PEP-CTERM-associated repeat protein